MSTSRDQETERIAKEADISDFERLDGRQLSFLKLFRGDLFLALQKLQQWNTLEDGAARDPEDPALFGGMPASVSFGNIQRD